MATQGFDPRQVMHSETFEVFHYQEPRPEGVEVHHHDFYEVYYLQGGYVEYWVDGRIIRLEPGDILLINPQELHRPLVGPQTKVYDRIVLWINKAYLDQELSRCFDQDLPNRLSPGDRERNVLKQLVGELVQEYYSREYGSQISANGLFLQLMVRLNPIYDWSKEEIDAALAAGADTLMLPYFRTVREAEQFLTMVNGRARTILLVETPEAVENLDEILALPGIDECHIGLNDLHLGYGRKFMFELLADGTVDAIVDKFKAHGIPFGIGGIARLGRGTLPAERILAEHVRLGSQAVILSRSFCNDILFSDRPDREDIFIREVSRLRQAEGKMLAKDAEFFADNRRELQRIVSRILEG